MVLKFYFQTMDYETLFFYQESFIDFLCKFLIQNLSKKCRGIIFIFQLKLAAGWVWL